jgi:hypothetical protein
MSIFKPTPNSLISTFCLSKLVLLRTAACTAAACVTLSCCLRWARPSLPSPRLLLIMMLLVMMLMMLVLMLMDDGLPVVGGARGAGDGEGQTDFAALPMPTLATFCIFPQPLEHVWHSTYPIIPPLHPTAPPPTTPPPQTPLANSSADGQDHEKMNFVLTCP